jgi:hypothetical protein
MVTIRELSPDSAGTATLHRLSSPGVDLPLASTWRDLTTCESTLAEMARSRGPRAGLQVPLVRRVWFADEVDDDDDRDVTITRLLTTTRRWAVVGLSANDSRPAYAVARFLQRSLSIEIVPVHPKADTVHGAAGYATLADVPGPVDVVDVFVRSALAGSVVDEAIALGARAVWLQLGIIDAAAAARARAAGLDVVMDACPAIEAPRLGLV